MPKSSKNDDLCEVYLGDPKVFSVEKILKERGVETEIEYFVKWRGYSNGHNEWVAKRYVTPDLIRSFSEAKKKKEMQRLKKDRKAKTRVLHKKHGGIAKKTILGATSTPFTDSSKRRSTRLRATSTPFTDSSKRRSTRVNFMSAATLAEYFNESETGLSAIMSGEPEPDSEISEPSERIEPKEDDEESRAMMSEADESDVEITTAWAPSQEYNNEGDISTSPSKSDGIFAEKRTPAVPDQGTKSIVETGISSLTNVNEENGVLVSATLTNSDTTPGSKSDGNFDCSFASMTLAVSSESSEFDSVQNEPNLL